MEFDFKDVIIGVAAFLATFYFKQIVTSLKEVVNSVKELNEKMAIIIERTETHAKEIDSLREKQDVLNQDFASIKTKLEIIHEKR